MSENTGKPAPDWYPHPTDATKLRFWDGDSWTDHVKERDVPAPAQPKRRASWTVRIAVILGLVLVFGGLWFFLGYNSAENKAVRACHDYVELQLKAPSTADFSSESATRNDDDTWHVSGIVDSENSFGAKVRNVFDCDVDDSDYSVFGTHFSEDDG